jgi:hypothetical protein
MMLTYFLRPNPYPTRVVRCYTGGVPSFRAGTRGNTRKLQISLSRPPCQRQGSHYKDQRKFRSARAAADIDRGLNRHIEQATGESEVQQRDMQSVLQTSEACKEQAQTSNKNCQDLRDAMQELRTANEVHEEQLAWMCEHLSAETEKPQNANQVIESLREHIQQGEEKIQRLQETSEQNEETIQDQQAQIQQLQEDLEDLRKRYEKLKELHKKVKEELKESLKECSRCSCLYCRGDPSDPGHAKGTPLWVTCIGMKGRARERSASISSVGVKT